jgi:HEAT repeat protein
VSIVASERENLCDALRVAGVRGVEDFGRFVNNTDYFRASSFDDERAAPVLLARLRTLADDAVVAAVARHLRHVRIPADAFDSLVGAFDHWAPKDTDAGWALGDTLAHAARPKNAATMCELAQRKACGHSRQMIVDALWRWRKLECVEPTLRSLVTDPDVSLHAMSALARVITPSEMLAVLEQLQDDADPTVRKQAQRRMRKVRRKVGQ